MARHILIVDESEMMRRVLGARILSVLDDAVILQANGVDALGQIVDRKEVHLILYSWDIQDEIGLQLCTRLASRDDAPKIPFLFLISEKKEHVEMAAELVGSSHLVMPCPPETLCRAIDRVCSPVTLRQTKRYSIGDTHAVIEQRQVRSEAAVINISTGGALCELDLDPMFSWAYPLKISIKFATEKGPVEINDLPGVISNMKVMSRHPDQTPSRIRAGVKFLNLCDAVMDVLDQVFAKAEEE